MSAHAALLGLYLPCDARVHRWPVWTKYLVMFLGGLVPFLIGRIWVSVAALVLAVFLLVMVARLPIRRSLALPWPYWLMMALLLAYHAYALSWRSGVLYLLNLTAALYLARLVTMTTPAAQLMDAISTAARPLRLLGADPEKTALAIALMWRSIPHLLGSISETRDAARARGLGRYSHRFILPVVIGAVGYALQTQDALRARGLAERFDSSPEPADQHSDGFV